MPKERRQHPRKPVHLTVHYKLGNDPADTPDIATDLSQSGLFIQTKRAPKAGHRVQLELSWDAGGPSVNATCEVTRGSKDGVGLKFTEMDPDTALLLNHFLSR
jgi:hypothetical protein